jgi:hypothetical protein
MVCGVTFTTLHFIHNLQLGPMSLIVTLHYVAKACQGQTLQFLGSFTNYKEN